MNKPSPVYLVVINLTGVHGPIKCYRLDQDKMEVYDTSLNWSVSTKGKERNKFGYHTFKSGNLDEAKLFAEGAKAVCKHLRTWAK